MGLTELHLETCPCARIGSRDAGIILKARPMLATCSWCDKDAWVSEAGHHSGLPLVCTHCLGINPDHVTGMNNHG
jgi:hypothetical protein